MHLKVFTEKSLPLSSEQIYKKPQKKQKNQKNPEKTTKNPKNTTALVFF
jgi:hypothetical protein